MEFFDQKVIHGEFREYTTNTSTLVTTMPNSRHVCSQEVCELRHACHKVSVCMATFETQIKQKFHTCELPHTAMDTMSFLPKQNLPC